MEYVIKILREEKQRLINQRQMFRLALTKNSIDSRNKIDDEISQIERAMVELSNVSQANELLPHVSNSVCTCGSSNYGYGFAKCYDCGKIKDF
jgi:RNA polymerase-binding transcription factor DksA